MTTGGEGRVPDGWAVHQVLPSLHVADASGAHTLHARDALRDAGFASEIFVEHVDPPLAAQARPFDDLDRFVVPGRSAVLYQLAVGSVLVDHLLRRREPLLVNYHNLTPASFFWQWAPDWLYAVEAGREQLYRLAPRVTHAIAVSRFNEQDLQGAGYRSTSVVPPFVDVGAFARGGVRAVRPPTRPPGAPGGGGGARSALRGQAPAPQVGARPRARPGRLPEDVRPGRHARGRGRAPRGLLRAGGRRLRRRARARDGGRARRVGDP